MSEYDKGPPTCHRIPNSPPRRAMRRRRIGPIGAGRPTASWRTVGVIAMPCGSRRASRPAGPAAAVTVRQWVACSPGTLPPAGPSSEHGSPRAGTADRRGGPTGPQGRPGAAPRQWWAQPAPPTGRPCVGRPGRTAGSSGGRAGSVCRGPPSAVPCMTVPSSSWRRQPAPLVAGDSGSRRTCWIACSRTDSTVIRQPSSSSWSPSVGRRPSRWSTSPARVT